MCLFFPFPFVEKQNSQIERFQGGYGPVTTHTIILGRSLQLTQVSPNMKQSLRCLPNRKVHDLGFPFIFEIKAQQCSYAVQFFRKYLFILRNLLNKRSDLMYELNISQGSVRYFLGSLLYPFTQACCNQLQEVPVSQVIFS